MSALRPGFDLETFVERVDRVQRPQGYRLVVTTDSSDAAVAVAGFRMVDHLAWGRSLYVDDLSTLPDARKGGHASALLRWLRTQAALLECEQLHLDSNVGPHRADAHRLYMNHGLAVTSLHFASRLTGSRPGAADSAADDGEPTPRSSSQAQGHQ